MICLPYRREETEGDGYKYGSRIAEGGSTRRDYQSLGRPPRYQPSGTGSPRFPASDAGRNPGNYKARLPQHLRSEARPFSPPKIRREFLQPSNSPSRSSRGPHIKILMTGDLRWGEVHCFPLYFFKEWKGCEEDDDDESLFRLLCMISWHLRARSSNSEDF